MTENSKLYNLGAYELMQILHELHKLGYQKLRWMSYMAPTGLSLRCHITTQDHILANQEIAFDSGDEVWCASVNKMTSGNDIKPLVKTFMVGKQSMPAPPASLRLISWNIDGMKAHIEALRKLAVDYSPDIICLQKVKDVAESHDVEIDGYRKVCNSSKYAGVAIYYKCCMPCNVTEIGGHELKGHLLKADVSYPPLTLYNVYTPYSNPKVEGAIEHREKFDEHLKYLVHNTPDRMVICGDMNIVATERDCWDGKYKRKQANFHDWERNNFDEILKAGGLVDTFREFHPHDKGFSYFFRNDTEVRAKNQGHRIDYFLASRSLVPQIVKADIIKDCTVTTNNPILLEIKY